MYYGSSFLTEERISEEVIISPEGQRQKNLDMAIRENIVSPVYKNSVLIGYKCKRSDADQLAFMILSECETGNCII